MTRINTNVASLVAQNNLSRSNTSLNQSLTRLSTGLRINTGKDDPAGLIASENLRSDITAIRRAIGNTDRANQVIATADSALGQVSSLLNDIRGLVTESANVGALSDEQLAANQLQLDSSLEALNRIAQTTTFQGRRLLDGSLDFITSAGAGFSNISELQIDQANLGATGSVGVEVSVTTAATQAQVQVANIPAGGAATAASGDLDITINTPAVDATGTLDIAITEQQAVATLDFSTTVGPDLTITALDGGNAEGAFGAASGGIDVVITDANTGDTASYNQGTNTIEVTVDLTGGAITDDTIAGLISGINGGADFSVSGNATTTLAAGDAGTYADISTGGRDASTEQIAITSNTGDNIQVTLAEGTGIGATPSVSGDAGSGYTVTVDDSVATTISDIATAILGISEVSAATYGGSASYIGSADVVTGADVTLSGGTNASTATETIAITTLAGDNNFDITLAEGTGVGATPTVTGDATTGYTITVDDTATTTVAAIATAIEGIAEVATASYSGSNTYDPGNDAPPAALSLTGGAAQGGLTAEVVFELAGTDGSEVLSFGIGTSISDLVSGINLVSDATGVQAAADGTTPTTLNLTSTAYGSDALVDIQIISEGTGASPAGTFTTAIGQGSRDTGTDIVAAVNGVSASGDGNVLSINTATLDLTATINAGQTGSFNFTISGGGALFQLGPEVVSNQQARLGVSSVNTARLGGVSGKLFQLGSGGTADLTTDTTTAASIVGEAIDQVTSLRGRLGAFQRTTLETNKAALNDTLVNLTDAESAIRDADFAEESAALTRSQILVQSGTSVLSIANQNPQNVLALLR